MGYRIFTRTWWKKTPDYPDGLEPHAGRQTTIGRAETEAEAVEYCRHWNATHNPGKLSRKAEFDSY